MTVATVEATGAVLDVLVGVLVLVLSLDEVVAATVSLPVLCGCCCSVLALLAAAVSACC